MFMFKWYSTLQKMTYVMFCFYDYRGWDQARKKFCMLYMELWNTVAGSTPVTTPRTSKSDQTSESSQTSSTLDRPHWKTAPSATLRSRTALPVWKNRKRVSWSDWYRLASGTISAIAEWVRPQNLRSNEHRPIFSFTKEFINHTSYQ